MIIQQNFIKGNRTVRLTQYQISVAHQKFDKAGRIKGEITQKVLKQGLSFLYSTHFHDLFYITVKYHQNIPNCIQVIERT